jgi:PKD repeat protein
VDYGSHAYADADNHEDEGDSNGTSITVPPPANQPPVATFSYDCTDLTCDFNASSSFDPDGDIVAYDWDFGDGNSDTVVAPSHTYAADGQYTVALVVTDNLGATGTDSQPVSVGSGGGGDTMHVGDLEDGSILVKRDTRWNATVTITIHDGAGLHAPLSEATVTGTWSDGATGSVECTTGGSGQCSVTKANLKLSVTSVTFTVTDVAHATHSYDSTENDEPWDISPSIVLPVPSPSP